MDTITLSIIMISIIFFIIVGYFIKRYKHHHTLFHSQEEEPVFTELEAEETIKKHSKHKVLGHAKIKKLVRKGK